MVFPRYIKFILYAIAGISVLVLLLFYAGPRTIDYDELDSRVQELMNPPNADLTGSIPVVDTAAVDTTMADTTAMAAGDTGSAEPGEEGTGASPDAEVSRVNLREHLSTWEYIVWHRTDIALVWSYLLILLTVLSAIIFPLMAIFRNPRTLIRLVGVLAGAAILVVISYLLASDTPMEIIGYSGTVNRDPGILKMIDTILFVTYLLFGLAILSIFYSVISRAFK